MNYYRFAVDHEKEFFTIFRCTLHLLNSKRELERLVKWATYNGHENVRRAYMRRQFDQEQRLLRLVLCSKRAVALAKLIHFINGLLFPPPTRFHRGSARMYRYAVVDKV